MLTLQLKCTTYFMYTLQQCLDKITTSHILEPWCDIVGDEKQGPLVHHMPSNEGISERFLQAAPLHEESWCRVIVLFIYST